MIRAAALIPAAAGLAAAAAMTLAQPPAATARAVAAAAPAGMARATATSSSSPKPPSPRPTPHPTATGGNGGGGHRAGAPSPLTPVPVTPAVHPTRGCHPSTASVAHVTKQPWAQRALVFPSVWPLARGNGVTVAVVDSGVDYTPQLAGRMRAISLVPGGGNRDCAGHGTAVAGIIAGSDLRKQGVLFTGVAPGAHILSVRVQAQRQGRPALLARGIRDAAALGARVINVSIETPGSTRALAAAVKYALRKNAVIVAAGGNDEAFTPGGQVVKGPFYPASYPGVISVGAVNAGGGLAPFSDQLSHVAVTAPGVNLVSTYPGGYAKELRGTSFAAPFVSGVAALILSRYPHLSNTAVVRRIEATADGQAGVGTGNGMVNPLAAVTAVLPAAAATASPSPAVTGLVPVATAPVPPPLPTTAALTITGAALAGALAVAAGAVVITRGRRRRWRAARADVPADDG
jgi:type VII secretion-associated serine protease mycosin